MHAADIPPGVRGAVEAKARIGCNALATSAPGVLLNECRAGGTDATVHFAPLLAPGRVSPADLELAVRAPIDASLDAHAPRHSLLAAHEGPLLVGTRPAVFQHCRAQLSVHRIV